MVLFFVVWTAAVIWFKTNALHGVCAISNHPTACLGLQMERRRKSTLDMPFEAWTKITFEPENNTKTLMLPTHTKTIQSRCSKSYNDHMVLIKMTCLKHVFFANPAACTLPSDHRWRQWRVGTPQPRQSFFSGKLEVLFLLHLLRPALIKNKQQLPAGQAPESWFSGVSLYHHKGEKKVWTLLLHLKVNLYFYRNVTSSPVAGLWRRFIYLLPASVNTLPLGVLRFSFWRRLFSNVAVDPGSTDIYLFCSVTFCHQTPSSVVKECHVASCLIASSGPPTAQI